MSSRFVKLTCAAALALPLAAIAVPAHAFSWTPEEECTGLSGAVTQHPHGVGGDSCYGIDQTPNHSGPNGALYTVNSVEVNNNISVARCDPGGQDMSANDSAASLPAGTTGEFDGTRLVGAYANFAFTLTCIDDRGPAHQF